jgi:hypothetical protein
MRPPELVPGLRVRITMGLASGIEAILIAKWPRPFFRGGPPMWRVQSTDLVRDRIVRADWLEVVP